MTLPATDADILEIEARHGRAWDMVHALCKPKFEEGSRNWTMSIPAQPEYDPDLVVAASLRDIPALLLRIKQDGERIKGLEAEREWRPYDTHPCSKGGERFLVWMSKPMLGSHVQVMRWHPNIVSIGGCFLFDAGGKPTHWQPLPSAPKALASTPTEKP